MLSKFARVVKISGIIAIVMAERLKAEEQRKILNAEENGSLTKITVDHFVQGYLVVTVTFLQITQQSLETSRLDRFQLLLHGFQIGSEPDLIAIIEDQMIGWVNTLQIKLVAQAGP